MVPLLNPSLPLYAGPMTSKDQPVAAITGAGGGIGSATARQLARAGYQLALSDVDAVMVEELAASLRADGVVVTTRSVDVADPVALDAWAGQVVADHGGVDVLINNAGVTTWGRYQEQSAADIDWLMNINALGVMHGCRAFLPALGRSQRAHIVNVSSMIALFAGPLQTTYTASKWAILGFSRALRLELKSEGIGVSCIIPGVTATPFMSDSRSYDAEGTATMGTLMRRHGMAPERVARRIERAIVRNQGQVHIGLDCHAVALIQRFLPGLLPWCVSRLYRRLTADGQLRVGGST
jgi:short-subunit dehydrogenase